MIYLDHNATTAVLPEVWEAMRPYQFEVFGNPASAHGVGRAARRVLEEARETVAALLGARAEEVIFTSGATEANNLAVFGLTGGRGGRVLTSQLEHPSVLEPLRHLERQGFAVDNLPLNPDGVLNPEGVSAQVRPDTRLLSVMLANHETGAIQPVAEIVYKVPSVLVHCDAVQAVGKLPVDFHRLGVASLTLSAHKFHGPRGIGALLLRRGIPLAAQLFGGHQQRGRRPGTESPALAVGLATALDLAERERAARTAHVVRLREQFLTQVLRAAAPVVVNGPAAGGLPHTVNLAFPGCQAESLLMNLDLAGVACSTGSACSSGSLLPSSVLQAMGVPPEVLHAALRFSFSFLNTEAEVAEAAARVAAIVQRLRQTPS